MEHHQPESACSTCHVEGAEGSHPLSSHEGCSGAGCHEEQPADLSTWTRESCVFCHMDYAEHKPEVDDCANCHAVPGIGSR